MIEVEKKFTLRGDDEKRLIEGAEFIGEKVFTDTYYDTADFSLTKNDDWLRQRGEKFELKISLDKAAGRKGDFYDELEDEKKIREYLNLGDSDDLEKYLLENGYLKFCICKTTRRKYKKNGFGIDIDFVEYGDGSTYELAEIELMVEDKQDMEKAIEKITNFAKEHGLEIGYVRGKVLVYLKEKNPDHFRALVSAGVVRE